MIVTNVTVCLVFVLLVHIDLMQIYATLSYHANGKHNHVYTENCSYISEFLHSVAKIQKYSFRWNGGYIYKRQASELLYQENIDAWIEISVETFFLSFSLRAV